MIDVLKAGERLDDLHRNNYKIIQHPGFFSFGMDAVLLSAFAKIHKNEKHLDLCTGNGIVPLLLAARYQNLALSFCGVEIQEVLADMARRSVAINGLDGKIDIVCGDIKQSLSFFGHSSFDVITANPPYMEAGSGFKNESYEMTIARHEVLCTLDDVCASAAKLLRFGGRFYMVHRPGRLADIVSSLRNHGLEPKVLRFVHPKAACLPNTLLVMAAKGGKPHLNVDVPLIVYDEAGKYTREVYEIYYG
jgi:tRNA1Val (adenine37-N6)-methyltransferase